MRRRFEVTNAAPAMSSTPRPAAPAIGAASPSTDESSDAETADDPASLVRLYCHGSMPALGFAAAGDESVPRLYCQGSMPALGSAAAGVRAEASSVARLYCHGSCPAFGFAAAAPPDDSARLNCHGSTPPEVGSAIRVAETAAGPPLSPIGIAAAGAAAAAAAATATAITAALP